MVNLTNKFRSRRFSIMHKKAILPSNSPLFDQEMQTLKPCCVGALKRIFIHCDHDGDGAPSDAVLNNFQGFSCAPNSVSVHQKLFYIRLFCSFPGVFASAKQL